MKFLTFVGAERFFPTFVHLRIAAIPVFPSANVSDGDSQTTKGFPCLPQLETYGIISCKYPRQKRTYLGRRCEELEVLSPQLFAVNKHRKRMQMGNQLLFRHNFSPWSKVSLHGRLKPTCWINPSMKHRPAQRIREHLLTANVVTRAKRRECRLVVGLDSSEAFDKVNWEIRWAVCTATCILTTRLVSPTALHRVPSTATTTGKGLAYDSLSGGSCVCFVGSAFDLYDARSGRLDSLNLKVLLPNIKETPQSAVPSALFPLRSKILWSGSSASTIIAFKRCRLGVGGYVASWTLLSARA